MMLEKTTRFDHLIAWIVILAALGFYAVLQAKFLIDPYTSWIHVETASGDELLRSYVKGSNWLNYLRVIVRGTGIDTNPARLRFVNNAVETFDSYWRQSLVTEIGFVPALSNASSLLYYSFCPLAAVLLARRIIGPTVMGAVAVVLAVGAFLTSIGYESASIFVFHPGKKIVIFVLLLDLIALLSYVRRPRRTLVLLIGLFQFVLVLTDEIGLVCGLLVSGLTAAYILFFARRRRADIAWLIAFVAATVAVYALNYALHWNAVFVQKLPALDGTFGQLLISMWPPGGLGLLTAHIGGAFSTLYGSQFVVAFLSFSTAMACAAAIFTPGGRATEGGIAGQQEGLGISQAGFLFLSALVCLALGAAAAVLLLRFVRADVLSKYNYYYASNLPVFAFFVECLAFRLMSFVARSGRPVWIALVRVSQLSLATALGLTIAANVQNMPRFNRLVGMLHYNPYSYGSINKLTNETINAAVAGRASTITVPRCSETVLTARYEQLLNAIGADAQTRNFFVASVSSPFVDDRVLRAFLSMMLRNPPPIESVDGPAGEC